MKARPHNQHPVRTLLLLVSGGALGFFLIRDYVMAKQKSPLQQIEHGTCQVDLDEDKPFQPVHTVGQANQALERRQRVFRWSQGQYRGNLDRSSVEALILAGRAESLEGRLSPEAKKALLADMASFDREFKEMILLVEEENEATKQKLRTTPGRHIIMRTEPYTMDPNWEAYKRAVEQTNKGKGAVWGDFHPEGVVQLVLLWKEWPGLKKLHDQRLAMIQRRMRRVRQWIAKEFEIQGVTLIGS